MSQSKNTSPKKRSSKKKSKFTGINFKIYENGDLYVGNLIRGKIQGAGIMFFENPKIRCEGVWSKGLLNGTGRQIGPLREKYIGEFINGVKNGQGRFTNKGKTVIGQFNEGEINGLAFITDVKKGMISRGNFIGGQMTNFGTLDSLDGRYKFSGFFKQGVFDGLGRESIGATTYFGLFLDGLREGVGKFEDGENVKFAGYWSKGEKKGFGIERYPSGDIYEGEFSNNLKNGIGRYHHKLDQSVYTGEFKDGLRCGFGKLECQDFIYIGDWENGQKSGKGYQYYKSGTWYYGEWLNGLKNGFGYETINTIFYKGEWENDKPHGYALIRDQEGVEKFAVFEYGILKNLSVNIPRKVFEYFDSISLNTYLEKSELRLVDFETILVGRTERMSQELAEELLEAVISHEEKKLFGILKQISINVENMEISFGKIMNNLEEDLKKANIDMRKLLKSYKYNIDEERREDVVMVMDANRGLKTLELMQIEPQEAEGFEEVTSLERREELKHIKRNLEAIFEQHFEQIETEEMAENNPIVFSKVSNIPMEDKVTDTQGLLGDDQALIQKKSELEEVMNLLKVEKEDIKKRKQELLMLLDEVKQRQTEQERLMLELENKKQVKANNPEDPPEQKADTPAATNPFIEDDGQFQDLSNKIFLQDFEVDFGEKNTKAIRSSENLYNLSSGATVHLVETQDKGGVSMLKSTRLGRYNFLIPS